MKSDKQLTKAKVVERLDEIAQYLTSDDIKKVMDSTGASYMTVYFHKTRKTKFSSKISYLILNLAENRVKDIESIKTKKND